MAFRPENFILRSKRDGNCQGGSRNYSVHVDKPPKNRVKNRVKAAGLAVGLCLAPLAQAQDEIFPDAPFVPEGGRVLLGAGQTENGCITYQETFGDPGACTLYLSPTDLIGIVRGDPDGVGIMDLEANLNRFPNSAVFTGWFFGFDLEYEVVFATQVENTPTEPFDFETSFDENSASPLPCLTGRFVVDQFGQPACGEQILQNIQLTIDALKESNVPVFLRLGYEAEGPWNGHDPEFYKELWRIVVEEIRRQEADNIATVWQIAAACFPQGQDFVYNNAEEKGLRSNTLARDQYGLSADTAIAFDQWFPDEDLVDWTGISYFTQFEDCRNGNDTLQEAVDFLRTKGKPILLAETAPRGMSFGNNTYTTDPGAIGQFFASAEAAAANDVSESIQEDNGFPVRDNANERTLDPVSDQEMFDLWFPEFIQFLEDNRRDIRAIAYINDVWQSLNRWQCDPALPRTTLFVPDRNCSEGYWGDTQLGNNDFIAQRWREEFVDNPDFLSASPTLFTLLQGFCERVPESPQCSGLTQQELNNLQIRQQTEQQAAQSAATQAEAAEATAEQTAQQASDLEAAQTLAAEQVAEQSENTTANAASPSAEEIQAANEEEARACGLDPDSAECEAARAESARIRDILTAEAQNQAQSQ